MTQIEIKHVKILLFYHEEQTTCNNHFWFVNPKTIVFATYCKSLLRTIVRLELYDTNFYIIDSSILLTKPFHGTDFFNGLWIIINFSNSNDFAY